MSTSETKHELGHMYLSSKWKKKSEVVYSTMYLIVV